MIWLIFFLSVVFCFVWTFFICRFCSFVCVFVVVVWGFLLVLFCFEFYFILSAKVSVCVTRSTRQPCSGNSGHCLTGLQLRSGLFSVCHIFRKAFISGRLI